MNAEPFMLPCLSKTLFGVECLGCGAQRALILLLEGEFKQAFYMYPAIYTLIPLALTFGLRFVDTSKNYSKILTVMVSINLIIMICAYIWKHWV